MHSRTWRFDLSFRCAVQPGNIAAITSWGEKNLPDKEKTSAMTGSYYCILPCSGDTAGMG
jgi:hypothetical protein